MDRAKHLFQSSVIVIIFFGLGKLTGLYRIQQVGQAFGTGLEFDAFTAANQIPEVFFIVIAGGSLAAAFIPVYSAYLMAGRKDGMQLANTILTLVMLVLGGVCLVAAIFSPWLTQVILVPEFSPESQALTSDLMRIVLIQTTIFGLSGVLSSILNTHQHFALPALAPLMLDAGYLLGIWFLVPSMGIYGLAWGTVIGSVLHVTVQLPALVRHRITIRPMLKVRLDGVREIIYLMGPRIVALGAIQVADVFIIRLASRLPEGSMSGYFYGYALMQVPETLFGTAIALVMFPTMAEMFNARNIEGMKRTAVQALSIIWTLTIPAAAALVLLGQPAISLFLERGAFDADSTRLVYSILLAFSLRVVAEATLEIVARLFYAQHNTRIPMICYLGWLVIHVGLAYLWVEPYGIVGVAFASTVAFFALSTALFLLNRRAIGSLYERMLAISAGRALVGTAVMALVIWSVGQFVTSLFLFLAIATLLGGGAYVMTNLLLGGQEIPRLIRLVRSRTV
jgi:putative peptidoglycan lipid II flippase